MGRILAIDYGIKRTGIAVTDPLRIIATGLTTVETPRLMDFLKKYCQQEDVDCFVVGEAKHMDNTPAESAAIIEPFVTELRAAFADKQVYRMDERFTSKMAFQSMIDSGLGRKRRQNKALVDEISAALILQNYMQLMQNRKC